MESRGSLSGTRCIVEALLSSSIVAVSPLETEWLREVYVQLSGQGDFMHLLHGSDRSHFNLRRLNSAQPTPAIASFEAEA